MMLRRTLLADPALLAPPALAQGFPTHPIRLLMPFAAGGAADSAARTIFPRMAERLDHDAFACAHAHGLALLRSGFSVFGDFASTHPALGQPIVVENRTGAGGPHGDGVGGARGGYSH